MIKDKEFLEEGKVFLVKVMKLDPKGRPTAEQPLADPWLQQP